MNGSARAAGNNDPSQVDSGAATVSAVDMMLHLSPEDEAAMLDWVFGAVGSELNPIAPLDGSADPVAQQEELITPDRLDELRRPMSVALPHSEAGDNSNSNSNPVGSQMADGTNSLAGSAGPRGRGKGAKGGTASPAATGAASGPPGKSGYRPKEGGLSAYDAAALVRRAGIGRSNIMDAPGTVTLPDPAVLSVEEDTADGASPIW
jgi:hypothetical protein